MSGWGRAPRARTRLVDVAGVDEARELLADSVVTDRGLITRGLGRSYGDAAHRSGGITMRLKSVGGASWLDRGSGLARCPAHLSIGDLVEFGAVGGFFVPVTPGTRHVTIGGAVAADIHGKDHHIVGSFGSHVVRMSMLLANGSVVDVMRDDDLFRATVGGMGLTGVILEVDVKMHPVPGNEMAVETFRTSDLDATMAALADAARRHRYSVAWIDLATTGEGWGRGVVTNGDHMVAEGGTPVLHEPKLGVPALWNVRVINRLTVRAFNEVWYRMASASPKHDAQTYDKFFYPLDAVRDWNRVYGRRGFLQYQLVIPIEAEEMLPKVADSLARAPAPVALAVLKRFGPEGDGYLSFPKPGWTLAADIPIPDEPVGLESALRSIDEEIAGMGGRVYLAKDSRLRPDLLEAMYPGVGEFRAVRDLVDPDRIFRSDLSGRLEL